MEGYVVLEVEGDVEKKHGKRCMCGRCGMSESNMWRLSKVWWKWRGGV